MSWSKQDIDLVRELWTTSELTGAEIAARLGHSVTRSAVMGLIYRLELPKRGRPTRRRASSGRPRQIAPELVAARRAEIAKARELRWQGMKIKDIAERCGRSVPWVFTHTQGIAARRGDQALRARPVARLVIIPSSVRAAPVAAPRAAGGRPPWHTEPLAAPLRLIHVAPPPRRKTPEEIKEDAERFLAWRARQRAGSAKLAASFDRMSKAADFLEAEADAGPDIYEMMGEA